MMRQDRHITLQGTLMMTKQTIMTGDLTDNNWAHHPEAHHSGAVAAVSQLGRQALQGVLGLLLASAGHLADAERPHQCCLERLALPLTTARCHTEEEIPCWHC